MFLEISDVVNMFLLNELCVFDMLPPELGILSLDQYI